MRTRRHVITVGLAIGVLLGLLTEMYFGPGLIGNFALAGS